MTEIVFKMAESEEFETQSLKKSPKKLPNFQKHGKRKAVSTTGKNKASKTTRWSDDEVDKIIDMLGRKGLLILGCFSKYYYHNRNRREN